MNNKLQSIYFDEPNHRIPSADVLKPPAYQQTELHTLEKALSLKPPAQLIDFGAGSGRATIHFLTLGFDVLAIDVSRHSRKCLTQLYAKHQQTSWGHLTTAATLPTQPLADGLIGTDILHHIDIPTYLPQFRQALKPHGHLAFSEPNAWHLPWYLYLLKEQVPWSIEKNIVHNNLPYLNTKFKHAGFHQIKITGHGFIPTPFTTSTWNLTLGRVFTPLAFRLILFAQNSRHQ